MSKIYNIRPAFSRRTLISISAACSTIFLLSACSSSDRQESNFDRNLVNPEEVSRFINDYFHKSYESGVEIFNNSEKVDQSIYDIIGKDKYDELRTSRDPYLTMKELSEDKKKEVIKKLSEFDSSSDLYDVRELNIDENLYLRTSVISLNNTLPSDWGKKDWSITASSDTITFEGSKASVPYSKLTYVYDGESQDVSVLPGGARSLFMSLDGKKWKIDGKKFVDQLLKLGMGSVGI